MVFQPITHIDQIHARRYSVYPHGDRSSVGRAPGCDPGCRGFESRRSPLRAWYSTLILLFTKLVSRLTQQNSIY